MPSSIQVDLSSETIFLKCDLQGYPKISCIPSSPTPPLSLLEAIIIIIWTNIQQDCHVLWGAFAFLVFILQHFLRRPTTT